MFAVSSYFQQKKKLDFNTFLLRQKYDKEEGEKRVNTVMKNTYYAPLVPPYIYRQWDRDVFYKTCCWISKNYAVERGRNFSSFCLFFYMYISLKTFFVVKNTNEGGLKITGNCALHLHNQIKHPPSFLPSLVPLYFSRKYRSTSIYNQTYAILSLTSDIRETLESWNWRPFFPSMEEE